MTFTPPALSLSQIGFVQITVTTGAQTPVALSWYLPDGSDANTEPLAPWVLSAYDSTLNAAAVLSQTGTANANVTAFDVTANVSPGYYTVQVAASNVVRAIGTLYVNPSANVV